MAGSRASFFGLSIGMFLVYMRFKFKQKRLLITILTVIIFSSLILIFFTNNEISQQLGRFSLTEIVYSSGSNRFTAYPVIIQELIPKYFFSFVGIAGQEIALLKMGYNVLYYPAAHNFIISSFAELGLLGFLVMMYLIFSSWFNLRKLALSSNDMFIF